MPLPEANAKKMQLLLNELSDHKFRHNFGLSKAHTNAFTINADTTSDASDMMDLASLETIITRLLDIFQYGAPSTDMHNAWQARWMGLVTSTAFQLNPAIQPRAFVALGCLAREEVDDDILYQILVALRGALTIFSESDPNLVLSIMMCLKNIVNSVQPDSRYLLLLFWVAIALVEINNGPTFAMSIEFLLSVLRTLESNGFFKNNSVANVLLAARDPIAEVGQQLDDLCGVNFESHFSFAISVIFLKGLRFPNAKDAIYLGLTTFLDIECKHGGKTNNGIKASTLGYLTGLLPMAIKNGELHEVLTLAGLLHPDETSKSAETVVKRTYRDAFDKLGGRQDDTTTATLLLSMLVMQLSLSEHESESHFLYGMLSEAAESMPAMLHGIYVTLLPKLTQMLASHSQPIQDSVKSIILTACSDPYNDDTRDAFHQASLLEQAGFAALGDPSFGASSINELQNANLASEVIEKIIA